MRYSRRRRRSFARSVAGRSPAAPQRILLLRLERIGDLLMALPGIAAVRRHAPAARIDLVVGSWNQELARAIPYVDDIETLDARWLARDGTGLDPERCFSVPRAGGIGGTISASTSSRISGATCFLRRPGLAGRPGMPAPVEVPSSIRPSITIPGRTRATTRDALPPRFSRRR